ncbi:hypothetical protein ACROYT_G015605 [Oculina patagonica]
MNRIPLVRSFAIYNGQNGIKTYDFSGIEVCGDQNSDEVTDCDPFEGECPVDIVRKEEQLMELDYHDLPYATNEDAESIITRKYNQRMKSRDVRMVKMAKDYGYIWILMAKIFKLRVDDDDSITREVHSGRRFSSPNATSA